MADHVLQFAGRRDDAVAFLVEAFHREDLADSVNHLLVVGFYLINVGYITLALKYGDKPTNTQTAIEFVSWKVGLVLVVLGMMHFTNLAIFSSMRRKGRIDKAFEDRAHPPMTPLHPPTA